ncbi:MAG: PEP-CTERM sorting domain-containing protein [Bryobacteraceae bacterium]|jgi:hypothetical protein
MKKLAMLLAIAALPLCAGNLVTNPGFETGDFTGWTMGGNFEDTEVVSGAFYVYTGAEEGTFYGVLGPVGSDATLSQTFADTLGTSYTFSFWLNAVGDGPSDFSAYWNGALLVSLSDPSTGGAWTQLTYDPIGTGSDTIEFIFRDDPAYIALDNISVDNATPEPGSLSLLALGLIAFAFLLRRNRNQSERQFGHR